MDFLLADYHDVALFYLVSYTVDKRTEGGAFAKDYLYFIVMVKNFVLLEVIDMYIFIWLMPLKGIFTKLALVNIP